MLHNVTSSTQDLNALTNSAKLLHAYKQEDQ